MAILIGSSTLEICNFALYKIGESAITQAELDAESPKAAELCAKIWPYVRDECLEVHPWNFAKKHRKLDYTDDFGIFPNDGTDNDKLTITNITKANPAVVSVASHPYSTTDLILIEDVTGMTEVNDFVFEIEDVDGDSFKLVGVDSTKYTAYVSGGTAIRSEVHSNYTGGYTYDVPTDCLKPLRLDGGGDFELIGRDKSWRILTNVADAILIYSSQITDTTLYPARFINMVASRLAAELAIPLKKKGAVFERMMQTYEFHLQRAALNDSKEVQVAPNRTDKWLSDAGYSS